jgi:hypothetical protein
LGRAGKLLRSNSAENGDEEMGPVRDEYVEECRRLVLSWRAATISRAVKSQAADREIDDFMTVPRSRPG